MRSAKHLRWLVALSLALLSAAKLMARGSAQSFLPEWATSLLAAIEGLLALGLLLPLTQLVAIWPTVALLGGFSGFSLVRWASGSTWTCGCLGQVDFPPFLAAGVSLGLLLLSLALVEEAATRG